MLQDTWVATPLGSGRWLRSGLARCAQPFLALQAYPSPLGTENKPLSTILDQILVHRSRGCHLWGYR